MHVIWAEREKKPFHLITQKGLIHAFMSKP